MATGDGGLGWAWLPATALLLALAGPAGAEAPQGLELSEDPDADQLCRAMAPPAFPEADRPTEEEVQGFRGRNCYAQLALHGIDQPLDVIRARRCAFAELSGRSEPDAVGGTEVLLAIYANGLGVPRNLDLALAIACAHSASPELRAFRVRRLEAMRAGRTTTPLDACEGPLPRELGWGCGTLKSGIARARREDRRRAVEARISQAAVRALASLVWTGRAYVDGHVNLRIPRQPPYGEDPEIMKLKREEEFLEAVEAAVGGPPAHRVARSERTRAEAALSAALRAQRRALPEAARTAFDEEHRRWLRYRADWARFGKLLHPQLDEAVWTHPLTVQRLDELAGFPADPEEP